MFLNQNYEPLNRCNFRRAIVLLLKGKVETLEKGLGAMHSASSFISLPSVIRLGQMIKGPMLPPRLSQSEVFLRDNFFASIVEKKLGTLP